MKAYLVIIILAVAVWWEYDNRLKKRRSQQRPVGVTRSIGRGVRQATQLSSSGNSSPGSGVQATQPAMHSTWGVGGTYGPGLTGPSYLPQHSSRRVA
jgi:hypothetical protein